MSEHLPKEEEAEFTVMTTNMYNSGGVVNVLDCLIAMMESQVVITKKLREILKGEKK
ncbi:MAG: hypothetical protein ACREBJ_08925 [Nitrosotalea sp.]